MTREALRNGFITEEKVVECLMTARGDLFIAASYLGVTGREIDSYIRASDHLKAFVVAIGTVKSDPEYDRMSAEQFEGELERLTKGYKMEALDVIHELATMQFETAAMAEVKLKAAVALRGAPEVKVGMNDSHAVMDELNRLYVESAPRIRSVRAVQIEYQT